MQVSVAGQIAWGLDPSLRGLLMWFVPTMGYQHPDPVDFGHKRIYRALGRFGLLTSYNHAGRVTWLMTYDGISVQDYIRDHPECR